MKPKTSPPLSKAELSLILKHARGFVWFTPKSLEFFCGVNIDSARKGCDQLALMGKLSILSRGSERWYTKVKRNKIVTPFSSKT